MVMDSDYVLLKWMKVVGNCSCCSYMFLSVHECSWTFVVVHIFCYYCWIWSEKEKKENRKSVFADLADSIVLNFWNFCWIRVWRFWRLKMKIFNPSWLSIWKLERENGITVFCDFLWSVPNDWIPWLWLWLGFYSWWLWWLDQW
jgi:hypothetical protein